MTLNVCKAGSLSPSLGDVSASLKREAHDVALLTETPFAGNHKPLARLLKSHGYTCHFIPPLPRQSARITCRQRPELPGSPARQQGLPS
eukprot:scaffold455765_cov37-Prasinocladus_malaysianus.AAC.2